MVFPTISREEKGWLATVGTVNGEIEKSEYFKTQQEAIVAGNFLTMKHRYNCPIILEFFKKKKTT